MCEWTPPSETYLSPQRFRRTETKIELTHKSKQVQPPIPLLRPLTRRNDPLVLMKLPFLDRNVNPDNILPHDAPSTDVQMPASSPLSVSAGDERKKERRTQPPNSPSTPHSGLRRYRARPTSDNYGPLRLCPCSSCRPPRSRRPSCLPRERCPNRHARYVRFSQFCEDAWTGMEHT